jgi:hypothetical protein
MTESPSRHWFLHPLWTALAVVLVVGVTLAATVGVYAWRRAAAMASIEQSGGYVDFDLSTGWSPPEEWVDYCPRWFLRVGYVALGPGSVDFAHLRALSEMQYLDLTGVGVHDADLAGLARFHRLESLTLDSPAVTDAGLESLGKCSRLGDLTLTNAAVGDAGLKHLAGLPLESLDLSNTRVTDVGMETLARFSRLETLTLDETAIGDAGLERLKSLPLASLSLARTNVTDAGLAAMGSMRALRALTLDRTTVGDAGLATVGTWTRVEELSLAGTKITDAGLAHLSKLPLTNLVVSGTAITDAGLDHLPRSPGWTWLELSGTRVTPAAAEGFAKPLKLSVEFDAAAGRLTIWDPRSLGVTVPIAPGMSFGPGSLGLSPPTPTPRPVVAPTFIPTH